MGRGRKAGQGERRSGVRRLGGARGGAGRGRGRGGRRLGVRAAPPSRSGWRGSGGGEMSREESGRSGGVSGATRIIVWGHPGRLI